MGKYGERGGLRAEGALEGVVLQTSFLDLSTGKTT